MQNILTGKNVLFTAGVQGIGEAITQQFTFTPAVTSVLGGHGIRVNAVAPGLIWGNTFHNTHMKKESANNTVSRIPIQKVGNADDVASTVLYSASEYNDFSLTSLL